VNLQTRRPFYSATFFANCVTRWASEPRHENFPHILDLFWKLIVREEFKHTQSRRSPRDARGNISPSQRRGPIPLINLYPTSTLGVVSSKSQIDSLFAPTEVSHNQHKALAHSIFPSTLQSPSQPLTTPFHSARGLLLVGLRRITRLHSRQSARSQI